MCYRYHNYLTRVPRSLRSLIGWMDHLYHLDSGPESDPSEDPVEDWIELADLAKDPKLVAQGTAVAE